MSQSVIRKCFSHIKVMRERKIKAELLKSDFLTKLFLQNEGFVCNKLFVGRFFSSDRPDSELLAFIPKHLPRYKSVVPNNEKQKDEALNCKYI